MKGSIQELVDRLGEPGFFDDLDGVIDWFVELYKFGAPPIHHTRFPSPLSLGNFPAHLVLEHFGKHGLTPQKHSSRTDEEATRTIYNEYIIGQLLEDVCGLNEHNQPWMLGNRVAMLIERRNHRYPK